MTEHRTRRQVLQAGVPAVLASILSGCSFAQRLDPQRQTPETSRTNIEIYNLHSQPHTVLFELVAVSSKKASIKQKNVMVKRTVTLPASDGSTAKVKTFQFKVTEQDVGNYLLRAKTNETNWVETYLLKKFESIDNLFHIRITRKGTIDIYLGEEEATP